MEIPESDRRREITRLLLGQDYVGLVKLGLVIEDAASGLDCGYYLLSKLGLPAHPGLITYLNQLLRLDEPGEGDIALYGNRHGVRHYGMYRKGKVHSKWGHGPVFTHAIEDVPLDYGDRVQFAKVTAHIYQYWQEIQFHGRMHQF